MSLKSEDWEKINGCLTRLYRELDRDKYIQTMLQTLSEVVPCTSIGLNMLDLATKRYTAVFQPPELVTDESLELTGRYLHQSPFPAYCIATQDSQWKMTTDFMPVESFHTTELYTKILSRFGIKRQMNGLLAVIDGTVYALVINRTEEDFYEHERDILNILHPHLVTGFINAYVCTRSHNSKMQIEAAMDTAPGAYGYFNTAGKIDWLQARAIAWLKEFFMGEVFHDQNIPASIYELLGKSVSENYLPKQLNKAGEKEILIVCLGPSPIGGWIMRLERRPKIFPPYFREMPCLTKRQNEVLRWMVEGKRNGEIAAILHLSPRTVEKHVAEILKELKVENRATAILKAMEFCMATNQNMQAVL